MATFYLRTVEELIEDDLLCTDPCEHRDCAANRIMSVAACRYCGERAAGSSGFIEEGNPVHALCVMAAVQAEGGG